MGTIIVKPSPSPIVHPKDSGKRPVTEAVAYGIGTSEYSVWVELSISGKNLINKDFLSLSDPFAVLSSKAKDGTEEEISRTEVIPNNLNPKFVKAFHVLYEFERVQRFVLRLYDADQNKPVEELKLEDQDFLGCTEFALSDIVTDSEGKVELPLMNTDGERMAESSVVINYEEQSNQTDKVIMSIACALEKRRSDSALLFISKKQNDDSWVPVYRSEAAKASGQKGEYNWNRIESRLRDICNADLARELAFEVWFYRSYGNHQLAGRKVLTLTEVESLVNESVDLSLADDQPPVGQLIINRYKRIESPSFLEYIASGFEINFLVAIDFTMSNGLPDYPTSLHHVLTDTMDGNRRLNVYEEAIFGVGKVLEAYDSDKLFPTWGFGAKLSGNSNAVNHCFAVNGDDAHPECKGVRGILDAYREALKRVTLAGPTFFHPVMKAAATMAARDSERKYYCLLMITDGILLDAQRTKREIIAASSLPLSIMIVGVGKEDFSRMEELDSDEALLTQDGVKAERDIVQFVEFEKYKNNGEKLASELLAEFPGQFLSYMKQNDIKPIKRERLSNRSSQAVEGEESHKILSAIRTQTEEDIVAIEGDN